MVVLQWHFSLDRQMQCHLLYNHSLSHYCNLFEKKLICSMFLWLHFISLKLISPTSLQVGWVCSGFSFYTIVNIHRKKQVNQTVRFELVMKQSIRCEIEWSRFCPIHWNSLKENSSCLHSLVYIIFNSMWSYCQVAPKAVIIKMNQFTGTIHTCNFNWWKLVNCPNLQKSNFMCDPIQSWKQKIICCIF